MPHRGQETVIRVLRPWRWPDGHARPACILRAPRLANLSLYAAPCRAADVGSSTIGDVAITKITATADSYASTDDSLPGAIYQRLRQIEMERVKALNDFYDLSRSQESRDLNTLHTAVHLDGRQSRTWQLSAPRVRGCILV